MLGEAEKCFAPSKEASLKKYVLQEFVPSRGEHRVVVERLRHVTG